MMVGLSSRATAQEPEFTWFRIYGVEGHVSFRTFFDDDRSRFVGGPERLRQRRPAYEEEIYVNTHSYIFHPNFLDIELGGGPVFVQESFFQQTAGSEGQRTSSPDTFYNFNARLDILKKKPYPLALFYERRNPRVPLGLAERFFLSDTKYGFRFSFHPFQLTSEGGRQRILGNGFNQITDEDISYLTLRSDPSIFWKGKASLVYQFQRQDSLSGNPQLIITRTLTTQHTVNLTTTQTLGKDENIHLQNTFLFLKRLEFPATQQVQWGPQLRWELTESLDAFARYRGTRTRIEDTDTTIDTVEAGLNHRLYESLFSEVEAHADRSRTTGLFENRYGGGGRVDYRKRVPFGRVSLNLGAVYDLWDRFATAAQVPVFGEVHVLTGLTPSELERENVILPTVVVFNETRSRTFAEGVDYRITVIGTRTRIERIPTGDILDGQTVLIDYRFATTGTFTFSVFDRQLGAQVDLFSILGLLARFRNAPQRLIEGVPTQPLNSVRNRLYSARFQLPLLGLRLEAQADWEDQDETISPYLRQAFTLSLQIPLGRSTFVAVSGRRVLQDNLNSIEDIDLKGGSLRLESRLFARTRLSAEATYEQDLGGTNRRRDWIGLLLAEWWFRNLTLRATARFRREQLVGIERDRALLRLELRREF